MLTTHRCRLRLLIFIAAMATWSGAALGFSYLPQDIPNARLLDGTHVSDPDRVLQANQISRINDKLTQLERSTGAQVAVVVVNEISGVDLNEFAQTLFDQWGIGAKGKDNGLLVLLVTQQRQVRFHTGYGLEARLPDVLGARIQRELMVPHFQRNAFGEGLLAGIDAVSRTLADPPDHESHHPQPAKLAFWGAQTIALLTVTVLCSLGCIAFRLLPGGSQHVPSHLLGQRPLGLNYSFMLWLILFCALPLVSVVAAHRLNPSVHWVKVLASLYAYGMALAIWHMAGLIVQIRRAQAQGLYADAYRLIQQQMGFWIGMAFVFPMPLAVSAVWLSRWTKQIHGHPRVCPSCRAAMLRLSEVEEDAHLSKGQKTEEAIGSREHDVWRCSACGTTTVESHAKEFSSWTQCGRCKAFTEKLESTKTLRAPTKEAEGRLQSRYVCMTCSRTRTEIDPLQKLTESPESSRRATNSPHNEDSPVNRSSGGPWGGGRSGGGGSNANW